MELNFRVISISHKNSPVQVRELMALDNDSNKQLLDKIELFSSIKEAVVLSTCNRTEIYYVSERDEKQLLIRLIGLIKGKNLTHYQSHFIAINNSENATRHLFRVAAGLESQLVGDLQIQTQIKLAYQLSVEKNFSGPLIHRLLHCVFFTNKRIAKETAFKVGSGSISYTASELVKKLTRHITNPKVLIIGLGSIGRDTTRHLLKNHNFHIHISNRTKAKSIEFADTELEVIDFEQVFERMNEMDVVVSSVVMDRPYITKTSFDNYVFKDQSFIDLSVPRSISSSISELPGVNQFNIDHLQLKVDKILDMRQNAIPQVENIISESIDELKEWSKEVLASPTIKKIKRALEQIRREELARYLKNGNSNESKIAQEVTKGMVQKIMKLPVLRLKAACKKGEADELIEILGQLFDLEQANTYRNI